MSKDSYLVRGNIMDIYYRGFDSDSPISTGTKHLTACAARLLIAMLRSIQYMDDAAIEAFNKYVKIDNIWMLCLMLAGWLLAAVVGGTIGAAVGAILAFLGAQELFDRLNDIYAPLKDWALLAYNANNDDDIDKAAKKFAPAFATGFLTAIEFVVLNKIFRSSAALLSKRFPRPGWIDPVWDRTVKERSKRGKRKADESVKTALPQMMATLQTKGAMSVARGGGFPVGAVVVAGVGLTVGTVVMVAALSGKERSR
jgi:hypothetical protein